MFNLDLDCTYNSVGKIQVLKYAEKAASRGDNLVAISNKDGVVLASSHIVESELEVMRPNTLIKKLNEDNIYISTSGVMGDGYFLQEVIKRNISSYKKNYGVEKLGVSAYKSIMFPIIYQFISQLSLRPLGINTISMLSKDGVYTVCVTKPTAEILECRAYAVGSNEKRLLTELEKLDIDNLSLREMVKNSIRLLYISKDPSSEKRTYLEVGVISKETNAAFRALEQDEIKEIIEELEEQDELDDQDGSN